MEQKEWLDQVIEETLEPDLPICDPTTIFGTIPKVVTYWMTYSKIPIADTMWFLPCLWNAGRCTGPEDQKLLNQSARPSLLTASRR